MSRHLFGRAPPKTRKRGGPEDAAPEGRAVRPARDQARAGPHLRSCPNSTTSLGEEHLDDCPMIRQGADGDPTCPASGRLDGTGKPAIRYEFQKT